MSDDRRGEAAGIFAIHGPADAIDAPPAAAIAVGLIGIAVVAGNVAVAL